MFAGRPLNHCTTNLGIASEFTQTKIELAIKIIRVLAAVETAGFAEASPILCGLQLRTNEPSSVGVNAVLSHYKFKTCRTICGGLLSYVYRMSQKVTVKFEAL
jgi:hypothetical protein